MTCTRCGLAENVLADGYPPAADVALLLEECPPPILSAFVQALRDHISGKSTGGGAIRFDGSRGAQHWKLERNTVQSMDMPRRKRA